MGRNVRCSDCPCSRCKFVLVPRHHNPCAKCSVLDWSMFVAAPRKKIAISVGLFTFTYTPKHLCPICQTPLQEEGELKPETLAWDGDKVFMCPSCGFERDDRGGQKL